MATSRINDDSAVISLHPSDAPDMQTFEDPFAHQNLEGINSLWTKPPLQTIARNSWLRSHLSQP